MRLLEVNGTSLLGATHQEAVNILRCSGNTITLVVCKGYDKNEVEHILTLSGGRDSKDSKTSQERKDSPTDGLKSLSQSISSLDRDDEDAATLRQEQEMKAELVAWEQEERERALVEQREKSTPEKVRIKNTHACFIHKLIVNSVSIDDACMSQKKPLNSSISGSRRCWT